MAKPTAKWSVKKAMATLVSHNAIAAQKIEDFLTGAQRKSLQTSFQTVDSRFIQEKSDAIRDSMLELMRNRKETAISLLLERNVWSSLDAMAVHLDCVGLTGWLKKTTPAITSIVRFDDSDVVSAIYEILIDFLGLDKNSAKEQGIGLRDIESAFQVIEKKKAGRYGLATISKKDFSLKATFTNSCGRPTGILERHAVIGPKGILALILFALAILLIIGGIILLGVPGGAGAGAMAIAIGIVTLILAIIVALIPGC